jgi:hypothetical protein
MSTKDATAQAPKDPNAKPATPSPARPPTEPEKTSFAAFVRKAVRNAAKRLKNAIQM